MFLQSFTPEQKQSFFCLCGYIVAADGILTDQEKAMLMRYAKELDLLDAIEDSVQPMGQVVEVFSMASAEVQKRAVLECFLLVLSDREYHEQERDFVLTFAKYLSLEERVVEQLEGKARAFADWYADTEAFLTGEGNRCNR